MKNEWKGQKKIIYCPWQEHNVNVETDECHLSTCFVLSAGRLQELVSVLIGMFMVLVHRYIIHRRENILIGLIYNLCCKTLTTFALRVNVKPKTARPVVSRLIAQKLKGCAGTGMVRTAIRGRQL